MPTEKTPFKKRTNVSVKIKKETNKKWNYENQKRRLKCPSCHYPEPLGDCHTSDVYYCHNVKCGKWFGWSDDKGKLVEYIFER